MPKRRIVSRAKPAWARIQPSNSPRYFILRENGSYLLREDGTKIRREN